MTIYFDTSWIGMSGIGRFSEELLKALKLHSSQKIEDVAISTSPASPIATLKNAVFSLKLNQQQNNIIFFPGYIPPLFSKTPFLFTIHDLNHLTIKENGGFLKELFYEWVIKRGCQKAAKIITVSEFSKNEIVRWAKVDQDRVCVIYNGMSNIFSPNGKKFENTKPYFFCVGNRKHHKNEYRLIEAFAYSGLNKSIQLLFNGKISNELEVLITKLNLTDSVRFLGALNETSLVEVYRGAVALTFVSLYEGFGLPVIEAMACGVPVITSTTTSLPEIAGDAALLVDPLNVAEIAKAMITINENPALRHDLITKGLQNVKRFSWKKSALELNEILDKMHKKM